MEEYFPHVPGAEEILRVGKAWHGLVEFVGYSAPWCMMDTVMLTTRSGKRIPYPASKGMKEKRVLVANVSPRACVYMHPLAVMEAEDANGNDFSGYVIVQASFNDRHEVCGLLSSAVSFFTPDDNSQAVPVVITAGGKFIDVYDKLCIGKEAKKLLTLDTGGDPTALTYVGFSRDGRSAFFSNDISPGIIFIDEGRWGSLNPEISLTSLSGNVVDGVSLVTASRTDIPVAEPDTSESYEYFQLYAHFSEDADGNIHMYEDETPNFSPIPGWGLTSGFSNSSSIIDTPCFLYVNEEGYVSIVTGKKSMVRNSVTTGSWSRTKSNNVITTTGTTTQTINESYNISYSEGSVKFADLNFSSSFSSTNNVTFETTIIGGSDDTHVTQDDIINTGSISVVLDGRTLLDLDGYTWFDGLNIDPINFINWFSGSPNPAFPVTPIRSYRAMEILGKGVAMVSIYLNPYSCEDILSIAVLVKKGTLLTDHELGGNQVDLSTVTQTLYIGKCFAGGVVFDDPMTIGEADFNKKLYRAYDPISKTISEPYDWPVFYQ